MSQQIEVKVGRDGRIRTEFTGFLGAACHDAADAIRRRLAALGVQVDALEVVDKTLEQMRTEVGQEAAERARVRPDVR